MANRRSFLTLLGGAAAAWPRVARAQQDGRVRRVGVLMPYAEVDPEAQARFQAFRQGLADLGLVDGRNLRLDVRWADADVARMAPLARELVALRPEVILSSSTPTMQALRDATRTIPIVFGQMAAPAQGHGAAARPRRAALQSGLGPLCSGLFAGRARGGRTTRAQA
jgi:putative ABC transport system substrate-binding protein